MMNRIMQATPLPDQTILLVFESGQLKLLDMKPYMDQGGVWEDIREWRVFSRVKVQEDLGGLEWPGEVDFCPDTAFEVSQPAPPALLRDLTVSYAPRERPETGTGEMV